ncbi:hypothetical protein AVANS_1784 [Campylobacter sp. RM5004]|uniref:TonB-dependent receptor n=1 Tax=Campylobacter sp. RM5004 TaxID=1660078 RepID=UPI001EFBA3A6|nr:TonB-dependent receptor [Campylobacter sp. RM5004]ULO02386.1 hypothetical protein AVANS_1784 [Campylobacter sp. RM5004]
MKRKLSLIAIVSLVYANEIDIGEIDVNKPMNEVNKGEYSKYSSYKEYNFSDTEPNKRIDESIKQNSNINLNMGDNISTNKAEISPKDFSINAAPFYQNAFLVNGMSFDNAIDPAGNQNINASSLWRAPVMGAQGSVININILKSLKILDSNISAKYGNFEGGVIDTKLKDPTKKFGARISTSYTDGNLNKIIIDEENRADYETSRGKNINNNFVKQNQNIYLESRFSDDYGILFDYSRTTSTIKMPTKREVLAQGYFYPNQSRRNENFLLKGFIALDNHIIRPSVIYAPSVYKGFLEGVIDSNLEAKFGGIISSVELFSEFDGFNITQNLGYSIQDSARYFDKNMKFGFFTNEVANWGTSTFSMKGGYGDIKERTKELNYKLDLESDVKEFKNTEHTFYAGLELSHKKASYETLKHLAEYYNPTILPAGVVCKDGDVFCLMGDVVDRKGNTGAGQYLTRATFTPEFKTGISATNFDLYLEDDIKYKRFNLRLGARGSYDGIIKKFNVAPRITSEFDLLGDESNFFGAGYNRYYGKNFFAYKLYDNIYSYTQFLSRTDYAEEFKQTGGKKNMYNFNELKRSFNDEFSVFYRGEFKNTKFSLKYLKRLGKNQVVLSDKETLGLADIDDENLSKNYKVYTNLGTSKADIISLDIANAKSIEIFNTLNDFSLSASYTKKKSDFKDYRSDERDRNNQVKYNGEIIAQKDLPIIDYYDKYKITFLYNLNIPDYGLGIANLFTFTPSKKALISNYNRAERIREYELIKLNDHFTWDMNIAYKYKMKKDVEFFANVNIENLLNTKNKINASKKDDKLIYDYASGRSIMLEVGLNY